jgi:hypothetical protein
LTRASDPVMIDSAWRVWEQVMDTNLDVGFHSTSLDWCDLVSHSHHLTLSLLILLAIARASAHKTACIYRLSLSYLQHYFISALLGNADGGT